MNQAAEEEASPALKAPQDNRNGSSEAIETTNSINANGTVIPPSISETASEVAAYIREASAPRAEAHQAPQRQEDNSVDDNEDEDEDEDKDEKNGSLADKDSSYWDAADMAPLTAQSAAALARLRAYRPPPSTIWDRIPVSRRAAVLLLLYADRRGDLRVVITMRATSLRSYSGHAAFPGGKADTAEETPYQVARREAWEEIGLPVSDDRIPRPFRIERLCELPHNIAQTDIVVRPCVAFLHADGDSNKPGAVANGNTSQSSRNGTPLAEDTMIPRLDAKEVAAVFSAPFHNFLLSTDEYRGRPLPPGHWYDGRWITFGNINWRVHNFYIPVDGQQVAKPDPEPPSPPDPQDELETVPPSEAEKTGGNEVGTEEDEEEEAGRYKVWGMTAHIIVDAARLAYEKVPDFEHNAHYGDEDLIARADKEGRFFDKKRKGEGGGERGGQKKAASAKM